MAGLDLRAGMNDGRFISGIMPGTQHSSKGVNGYKDLLAPFPMEWKIQERMVLTGMKQ